MAAKTCYPACIEAWYVNLHLYYKPGASNSDYVAHRYPRKLHPLGIHIGYSSLGLLTQCFFYKHLNPRFEGSLASLSEDSLPEITGRVSVFYSAIATFYAPSNPSSIYGMYQEVIRSTRLWNRGDVQGPQRDCVFIEGTLQEEMQSMQKLHIARVLLLFSFEFSGNTYSCALIYHYQRINDDRDNLTGMWIVEPRRRELSVICVDTILRGAHLLPVFTNSIFIPRSLNYTQTLDAFISFYVNRFVDHHAHEISI
jgi:hypothetical protein